jgi:hypothetical protein
VGVDWSGFYAVKHDVLTLDLRAVNAQAKALIAKAVERL